MAKTLLPNHENLDLLAEELRIGRLVAIPTETVYGLAGNIFSDDAVLGIFKAKERPSFDPLIVHFSQEKQSFWLEKLTTLSLLAARTQEQIQLLTKTFWPGPLTLVLPKTTQVSDLVTSGLPDVALRVPAHEAAQALLARLDFPLAAPSANKFGRISPTSSQDVQKELGSEIPWILEGGECRHGIESTVIRWNQEERQWQILRQGSLATERIEHALREKLTMPVDSTSTSNAQLSPGLLKNHYAPRKPLYFLETAPPKNGSYGFLYFSESALDQATSEMQQAPALHKFLGANDISAARELFRSIRELDESRVDFILVEQCPFTSGLGPAIQDRLYKASAK